MRIVIFALLFVLGFSVAQAAPKKPESWDVTALSEQTFLFEKKKVTVLVDVDFVPDQEEQVAKFIRSSDFAKAMKLLRNSDDLGLEGEPITVNATRKQYGSTIVGVTETLYKQGDYDAVLTEHWWVKNHLTFHVSVLSRGKFAQSNEQQELIFEPFAQDLGLIEGKTAVFNFLIPRAHADELRTSRGRTTPRSPQAPQSQASGAIDCQRDAASLGVDPSKARRGPPVLSPTFTSTTCKDGLKRIWDETKKSIFDLGNDFKNRSARLRRQLGCTGFPPPPRYESAKRSESYYQMFSRWGRNVKTAVGQAGLQQMAAQCEESAANGALAQMAGNAVVGTVRGLVSLAQLTQQLQYELTIGQVKRTASLIKYGKLADDDPLKTMGEMISSQWSGFKCLSGAEQAAKICKVGGEVSIAVASMAVGAGMTAAARLARIASIVGRAVETEQLAAKAALAAKVARAEKDAAAAARAAQVAQTANREREVAANAVRAANLNPAERARAASRILERSLSTNERNAVQRAHLFGKPGPDGKYSVSDLREKVRIMTDAGLSRDEAKRLIRTGATGADPAVTAAALSAATTSRTDMQPLTPGASVAETTIDTIGNAGKPAAYFREQAEYYEKTWANDLSAINDPAKTRLDLMTAGVPEKAADVSRMLMRSISPEDIASTEFVTGSAGGRYTQLMRYASFGGSSTSSDAGSMMARVLRELPAGKREEFLNSLNSQFTAQNRVLRGERTADASQRMGRSYPQIMERAYRETVDNAMGFKSSTSPEARVFYARLDNPSQQREAVAELMARPQMAGLSREEFMDLRANAAAGLARSQELSAAEKKAAEAARVVKPAPQAQRSYTAASTPRPAIPTPKPVVSAQPVKPAPNVAEPARPPTTRIIPDRNPAIADRTPLAERNLQNGSYSRAFISSFTSDGDVAVGMARETARSRDVGRITQFVSDLRGFVPKPEAKAQRAQLLRVVQEFRQGDAYKLMPNGYVTEFERLERNLREGY